MRVVPKASRGAESRRVRRSYPTRPTALVTRPTVPPYPSDDALDLSDDTFDSSDDARNSSDDTALLVRRRS